MRLISVGAAAAALLVTVTARAERERVAVASFEVFEQSPSLQTSTSLRQSLIGGLEAGGLEVVRDDETTRKTAEVPGLQSCSTMTCMRSLAELLGVRLVVKGRVEQAGSNFVIGLELIDPVAARTVQRVDDSCRVCTAAEVQESVSNAAHLLAHNHGPAEAKPQVVEASVEVRPPVEKPQHRRRWKLWLGVGLGAAVVVGVVVGVAVAETRGGTDFWSRAQAGCHDPTCQVVSYHP